MQTRQALQWAGFYLGLWILVTVVAGAFVVAGLALDGLTVIGAGAYTPDAFVDGTAYPKTGLAAMIVGVLAWQFGTTAAFFRTVVTAIEAETADSIDTESMKSDILSVLDDRLADMHQEISQTRQVVDRMGREDAADEFEFEDFE